MFNFGGLNVPFYGIFQKNLLKIQIFLANILNYGGFWYFDAQITDYGPPSFTHQNYGGFRIFLIRFLQTMPFVHRRARDDLSIYIQK